MTLKHFIPMHYPSFSSLHLRLGQCLQAAALLLALGTPSLHAATALLLSTDESNNNDTNVYVQAAFDALGTALGPSNVTDKRGALSGASELGLSEADFSGQNIVMLVTGYEPIGAARWAEVKNQLFTNPDTIFLFFVDGCCSKASNVDEVTRALDEATGLGLNTQSYDNVSYNNSILNLNSPYSSDFESQPHIPGLHAALITNVPAELALYLPPDADTLTPNAGERVDTLGFLVPKELNHEGLGACAFVLADSNAFQSDAALMVGNFVRAALNPNGACQLDFPGIDLSIALPSSFSAPPDTALTLPITIHNVGQESTSGGIVQIALPVGVRVVDADVPPNCSLQFEATDNQPQVLQCSLSALAPQASQTIALPIIGAAVGTFALQVEVQAIEVDIDLSNNRASSQIVVGAAAPVSPHPVPLNALWFLLGLSGLMAIGVVRKVK